MRNFIAIAAAGVLGLMTVPFASAAPATGKSGSGTIVIVFKDGHRQTFNLSDIERVEFPAPARVADEPIGGQLPPRGHYVGRWECGDGAGSTFYIDLKEGGEAWRSIRDVRGRWEYVNGEALITWDDGAKDAIRKVGSHYEKSAYDAGKSFSDHPSNVTNARLTNPKPI